MRAISIFGFLAILLAVACAVDYQEENGDDLATLEASDGVVDDVKESDVTTKAAEDCYVRITCATGATKSCYGTYGRCSASGSGDGSVTCNGSTWTCPRPNNCGADGTCNWSCPWDPDCEPPCNPICP